MFIQVVSILVPSDLTTFPQEPLDLARLYAAVEAEGGFSRVTAAKSWKRISVKMTRNFRQSFLWRLLQKQYRKYLLDYATHCGQQSSAEAQQAAPLDMVITKPKTRGSTKQKAK